MRGTIEMAAAMGISGTISWVVIQADQPVVSLVFWRCVIGALALGVVYWALGAHRGAINKRTIVLAALGGGAVVANWLLLFAAFPLASISIATAVYSTQPFILVGLGAMFLGERLTVGKFFWLGVAFVGVLIITQARPSADYVGTGYLGGIALAFGAAFFYALASILAKKLQGTPPHLVTLLQVIAGAILLAPFVDLADLPSDRAAWTNVAALGIIFTGLTFTLQYGAIQRLPTHLLGSLYFVYPAVAIFVDIVGFEHQLQVAEVLGVATILFGTAGMNLNWSFAGLRRIAWKR